MSILFPHLNSFWAERYRVRSQIYEMLYQNPRPQYDKLCTEIHFCESTGIQIDIVLNHTERFAFWIDKLEGIEQLISFLETLTLPDFSDVCSEIWTDSSPYPDLWYGMRQKLYIERLFRPDSINTAPSEEYVLFNAYIDDEHPQLLAFCPKLYFIKAVYYTLMAHFSILSPSMAQHERNLPFCEPLKLYNLFKSPIVEMFLDGRTITEKELKRSFDFVQIREVLRIMPQGEHLFWDMQGKPRGNQEEVAVYEEAPKTYPSTTPYLGDVWVKDFEKCYPLQNPNPQRFAYEKEFVWWEGWEAARLSRYLLPNDVDLLFLSWNPDAPDDLEHFSFDLPGCVFPNYQRTPRRDEICYLWPDEAGAVLWNEQDRLVGGIGSFCDTPEVDNEFQSWYYRVDQDGAPYSKESMAENYAYQLEGLRIAQHMRNSTRLDHYFIFSSTHISEEDLLDFDKNYR